MVFDESKNCCKRGGSIAGDARKNLEKESGKKIITKHNAEHPELLDNNPQLNLSNLYDQGGLGKKLLEEQ